MITRSDILMQGKRRLQELAISDTPYLDALVLMSHSLNMRKEKLLASLEQPIWEVDAIAYGKLITLRERGLPVAYIMKRKEFYGLEFYVDKRVLIPRPDTEVLVEAAIEACRSRETCKVLDLCTGSGCVGISIKHTLPDTTVTLSDISEDALAVASLNARNLLNCDLETVKSDLLDAIEGTFDIIVTNPPYLTNEECRDKTLKARSEPDLALRSGEDGFDHIRRIINTAYKTLEKKGILLIEGGYDQLEKTRELMIGKGYTNITILKDLAGHNRVVRGQRN